MAIESFPTRGTGFRNQITVLNRYALQPSSYTIIHMQYVYAILRPFLLKLGVIATIRTLTCIDFGNHFRFVFQSRFREAFYKERMITAIVQRDNEELQGYCANAIFKVR